MDPSVLLAVGNDDYAARYMAYIDRCDTGCPIFRATSLNGLDALYRVLNPEGLTIYVTTSAMHDELNPAVPNASSIIRRIKFDIEQGSPARMVKMKDLPSFDQCLLEASQSGNVFSRFTTRSRHLVSVA